jgi:hypothetical protein
MRRARVRPANPRSRATRKRKSADQMPGRARAEPGRRLLPQARSEWIGLAFFDGIPPAHATRAAARRSLHSQPGTNPAIAAAAQSGERGQGDGASRQHQDVGRAGRGGR